jgi:hypothetical protein
MQIAARQLDAHPERLAVRTLDPAERQPREVVIRIRVLLVTIGVDRLVEIAVAIHQPDPDERQGHVGRRLGVVAGEHAKTARIDPERLVEPVLRAEVGDRAGRHVGIPALEPVVRAIRQVVVEVPEDALDLGHERRVVEEARPLDRAAQYGDRIAVARPGLAIDPAPDRPGPGMPAPVQVVGEAAKTLELRRKAERSRGDRGDLGRGIHRGSDDSVYTPADEPV